VPCGTRDRSLDCKTISALHRAKPRLSCEARAKALCANSKTTAAPLISSALFGNARLVPSGKTKASSAQIASLCEANATLCRVQPRLSCEAKAKALLCAKSIADSASLPLTVLSAKKVLSREIRTKAPSANDLIREVKIEASLSANSEAISTLLTRRTLCNRAKLAFKGRAKTVASPCEATLSGKSILASPIAQKKVFKAKPRVSQPLQANIQFS